MRPLGRLAPKPDEGIPHSRNYGSRDGQKPRLIVLHTTESHNVHDSATDRRAVAGYLSRPDVDASCHVIVDDDGRSVRLVSDAHSAWTCAAYNDVSLNVEQIAFARLPRWRWIRKWRELRETARWIAQWSHHHNIPIQHTGPNGRGVIRHSELGSAGGGHSDPGANYPFGKVLKLARRYREARF